RIDSFIDVLAHGLGYPTANGRIVVRKLLCLSVNIVDFNAIHLKTVERVVNYEIGEANVPPRFLYSDVDLRFSRIDVSPLLKDRFSQNSLELFFRTEATIKVACFYVCRPTERRIMSNTIIRAV